MCSSEEILANLTELLLYYLEELKCIQDNSNEQFVYGERTAYVECLEIMQYWNQAREYGLNFDIESKYPL